MGQCWYTEKLHKMNLVNKENPPSLVQLHFGKQGWEDHHWLNVSGIKSANAKEIMLGQKYESGLEKIGEQKD